MNDDTQNTGAAPTDNTASTQDGGTGAQAADQPVVEPQAPAETAAPATDSTMTEPAMGAEPQAAEESAEETTTADTGVTDSAQ